ncbi:hypothetical protein [Nonomuraea rubra]|uniref:Uncharacterized protein n=1 Tax=Nonomuraea rubra TaxID=46180 RepID=A0A7X0TXA4_9ACTN|nr:hypothetical protein [Nonomuraea rubra]MBB6547020.1 hypothetical protein [Nonomuraea rubra]
MNLQAQIELITNPQDFVRLCNAVLQAEHGDDFLPIDDDRADRGNDGFLKSERRMFAAHCFKRAQNRSIDAEIRTKMAGDLKKAIQLKQDRAWDINRWTFLSNYPMPEHIAASMVQAGNAAGIEVSWRGPEYFADRLQRFKGLRELFPNLMANEVAEKLDDVMRRLDSLAPQKPLAINWVPRNPDEQRALIEQMPRAWEYLLFAGVLLQGRVALDLRWRDYQNGYGRRTGRYLDRPSSLAQLEGVLNDGLLIAKGLNAIFASDINVRAFGSPGFAGDVGTIVQFAGRIVSTCEDLLNLASEVRGTVYADEFRQAADMLSAILGQPIGQILFFMDRVIREFGNIPAWLATPNPPPRHIEITLEISVDERRLKAFTKEVARVRRRLRI